MNTAQYYGTGEFVHTGDRVAMITSVMPPHAAIGTVIDTQALVSTPEGWRTGVSVEWEEPWYVANIEPRYLAPLRITP